MGLNQTLAILKFSQIAHYFSCIVPKGKSTVNFLKVLWDLGLINGFSSYKGNKIIVFLKYSKKGEGLLKNMEVLYRPSKKVFSKRRELNFLSPAHCFIVAHGFGFGVIRRVDLQTRKQPGGLVICSL